MEAESLKDFLLWKPTQQTYIISSKILPVGGSMMLYGKYGSWKSNLAIHTAFCISSGLDWFGYKTNKSRVLIAQFEISKFELQERVKKYAHFHNSIEPDLFLSTEHFIKFDTAYGASDLSRVVEKTGAKVLIIDPLYRVISGHITDNFDSTKFIDTIEIVKAKYNLAVIITHHKKKSQSFEGEIIDRDAEEASGNLNFANWCDTTIGIQELNNEDNPDIELRFTKTRNSEYKIHPIQVHIDRATLDFKVLSSPAPRVSDSQITIRNLKGPEPVSVISNRSVTEIFEDDGN